METTGLAYKGNVQRIHGILHHVYATPENKNQIRHHSHMVRGHPISVRHEGRRLVVLVLVDFLGLSPRMMFIWGTHREVVT